MRARDDKEGRLASSVPRSVEHAGIAASLAGLPPAGDERADGIRGYRRATLGLRSSQ